VISTSQLRESPQTLEEEPERAAKPRPATGGGTQESAQSPLVL
jgi:hypothetical protein